MDEFRDGLGNAWANIAEFLPKLLGFLLILIIGYFVVKAIAKIVDRVLEKVGFDKAVERGGIGQALSKSRFDASDILSKVVFWALFLFVLQLAFGVFGPNPISDLIHGVIAYLPNVIVAIIIVVIGAAIAAAVKEIVEASLGGLSYGRGLAIGASVAILAVAVFAALDQLNIAPAIVNGLFYALLAIVVGSAVIAIGLGGVDTMRRYWERAANRADSESTSIRQEAAGSKERIQQRAQERLDQARSAGAASRPDEGAPRPVEGAPRPVEPAPPGSSTVDLRGRETRP
jgi:Conserved TM helix